MIDSISAASAVNGLSTPQEMQQTVSRMAGTLVVAVFLVLLDSASAQTGTHPEWCAGAGTFGDDGAPCPETRMGATECPAGCAVKVQQCETCGTQSTVVAVCGSIVVLVAFFVGVVGPFMNVTKDQPHSSSDNQVPIPFEIDSSSDDQVSFETA